MTIEQLIVQCLYEHRSVTLQNIGTFHLSSDSVIPEDSDKELQLPAGAISFDQNFRAIADENLVDFITKHSRKMRPLASSDLDSYVILQKQLLNIGNPLIIPGIGTLQKNSQGDLGFTQGKSISRHMEPVAQTREITSEEVSFKTAARHKSSGKNNILIIVAVLIILIGGSAAYYFMNNGEDSNTQSTEDILPVDSFPAAADTVSAAPAPAVTNAASDSSLYKVVVRSYSNLAEAENGKNRFESFGHKITLVTKDSSNFLLVVPIYKAGTDSTKAIDSLKRIFSYNAYILQ